MTGKIGSMFGMITEALLRGPSTRLYPKVPAHTYAHTRGHICIDITNCIYCKLCDKHCVSGAIIVEKAERRWAIDRLRCIACSACVESCPKGCLFLVPEYHAPVTGPCVDEVIGPAPEPATEPAAAT